MQPYLLNDAHAYQAWRERKLNNFPKQINELIIELNNPIKLVDKEINALNLACSRANMAIYRCAEKADPKQLVISLSGQLGLCQLDANLCADEDRISAIENKSDDRSVYIPYTNKALNWHTDGYYNAAQFRIHAFMMHCVRPANNGGENTYLDPEIVYILLRDENPGYIAALMQADAMTIPANEVEHREAQSGPVFYLDEDKNLCMRYTARKRNIAWKKDQQLENALACLEEILQDNPYMFHYRLAANEGVITNNVVT